MGAWSHLQGAARYERKRARGGRLQGVTLAEEGAGGATPVADTGIEEVMQLAA